MDDGIKLIFKTLIKVPIIIGISYVMFNIFAFGLNYFKLVGASYTVAQVGMENNFLPSKEQELINEYLKTLENAFMPEVTIGGEATYGVKRQYGEKLTVGVKAKMVVVMPLLHNEQFEDSGDPTVAFGTLKSSLDMKKDRESKKSENVLDITYTIPGLKYYPDLD